MTYLDRIATEPPADLIAAVEPAICDACHTDPARPGLLTCGPRCAIALAAHARRVHERICF